jgi:tRNA(Ile)-lysidine synthase TilS/MesJ
VPEVKVKEDKIYESIEERMKEEGISRGQIVTESIRTTYRKKIWSKFTRGVKDFSLIEDGDKIAVGISGGKDSLLMAKLFQELKKDRSKNFEVVFISMNPGFEAMDVDQFKKNLEYLEIPCEIFESNVWEVAFEQDPNNPCFLCAKMRRGVLYKKVEELGCNKLALGHHFDDAVETSLINMFYAGTVKTMLPKVKSTSGKLELIRPMIYIKEEDIINYTNKNEISPMTCGCPVESENTDSKRKEIKQLLVEMETKNPNVKQSIFNSMKNINLDYVMGYTRGNKKDREV